MSKILCLTAAAAILFTSVLVAEAKTETFSAPAEKQLQVKLAELALSQKPDAALQPKESPVAPPAVLQVDEPKRQLVKRDEVSDYEGWENKQRKK